jgi:hypothetical protein
MNDDPKELFARFDALAAEGVDVAEVQPLIDAYLRNMTAELWLALATFMLDDKEHPLDDDTHGALLEMRERVASGEVVPVPSGRMH